MNSSNETVVIPFLLQGSEDAVTTKVVSPVVTAGVLLSLFLVLALDVLILLAFVRDSKTDKVVRLVFGNIVLASLIVCVLSIMIHIISLALPFWITGENVLLCKAMIVLSVAAESGRMLFSLTYAVIVLMVIRFWDKPILSPRNVKYFIIVAVVLWCMATLGALPLIFDDVNGFCAYVADDGERFIWPFLYLGMHGLLYGVVPMIITIAAVTASFYYTKQYIILKKSATINTIIRFAVFVILDQVFTLLGHIGLIVSLVADSFLVHLIIFSLIGLSLVVSPVSIISLVETTRKKILDWFCCCNKKST